jgi:hypothetical protein
MPDAGGGIGLASGLPDLPDMHDLTGNARFQSLLGASQPQELAQGAPPDDPAHAPLPVKGQIGAPLPPGLAPPVQGAAAGAPSAAVPGRGAVETANGVAPHPAVALNMPAERAQFDLPRPGADAAAQAQPAATQPGVTTTPPAHAATAPAPAAAPASPSPAQAPAAAQHGSAAASPELAHPTMPAAAAAPSLPRPPAQAATQQPSDPLQTTVRATWHAPSHPAAGWLALAGATAALPPLPPVASSRPRQFQPLRAYRQPPQPALFWAQTHAAPPRRLLAYTDLRPVPLDLAPHVPSVACWRLDDTEALIVTGDPTDGGKAAALHARLMDHAAPLALLRPGEGFATWEGSPLWLCLAGIAKPPSLGVLLAESTPARLQVMRQAQGLEATWLRDGAVTQTRFIPAAASLPPRMLCGQEFPEACALATHTARALPDPLRWRVQEALAAAARLEIRFVGASATALRGRWMGLVPRGRAVLNRVLNGEVHGVDAMDGMALAMALDRLPMDYCAGALA